MKGDTAARGEYYTKLFNVGALSPNDIRAREGMNKVTGGDKYYVQMNMGDINAPAPDPNLQKPVQPAK